MRPATTRGHALRLVALAAAAIAATGMWMAWRTAAGRDHATGERT